MFVVPINDWEEITRAHMAVYRGIENGTSILRETDNQWTLHLLANENRIYYKSKPSSQ